MEGINSIFVAHLNELKFFQKHCITYEKKNKFYLVR